MPGGEFANAIFTVLLPLLVPTFIFTGIFFFKLAKEKLQETLIILLLTGVSIVMGCFLVFGL